MARGKSKTSQSSTLKKDPDAEVLADNKDQTDISHTKDYTGEGDSNNEPVTLSS